MPGNKEAVPMLMHTPHALIEPSFADAVAEMESAELSETTRRQRICSLRRIAKALDQPLELVPARWTAVRIPIGRLHHHPLGMTAKTLANHRCRSGKLSRLSDRNEFARRRRRCPEADRT